VFRLSCYPVFESYLLVVVVILLLVGLLFFAPKRSGLSLRRRVGLSILRCGVIILVALAMLRPTLVYSRTSKQAATLVILADQSRSMSVPDAVGEKTRWNALQDTLAKAASLLARVEKEFEVKAYLFDVDLQETPVQGGKIRLPDEPRGQQTAIGFALDEAARREAGKRLLGILLLSDGAQRAYAPHDLPPQIAAARLKHLDCPLFTFPFGQSRGLGEARDLALKDLLVPPDVFIKNELEISAQLRVDGYVNKPVAVEMLFETAPGKMEVIERQTLRATREGELIPVKFRYVPQTPGQWKLMLRAVEQPGELSTSNNELSTFVNVRKGGLNVLYIEGALRVEQKFLRRALDAAPDLKLDYVRIDPRNPQSRPPDLSARFKPGKYDVYLLGDIDSSLFSAAELNDLAECVSRGAGLMMLGGFQSFGAGGYGETALAKVLPVSMDRLERQLPDEPLRSDLHWPGPIPMTPTPLGLTHPAMRLSNLRQENARLWAELPKLDGANKFHDLSAGAVVLAEADAQRPLLVAHQFGDGRVLAFAGDSTWRWCMHGFEALHKRFWRQIVLWLARKEQMEEGGVWIRLAGRRFAPSERVTFSVGLEGATKESLAAADFKAEVVLPDGSRRNVPLVRQAESLQGVFRDTLQPGDYSVEVSAVTKEGRPLGMVRGRFLVFQRDIELDNASAEVETLSALAAAGGGEMLAPEQLPDLLERLLKESVRLEVREETRQTYWDSWPLFLAVVSLLSIEWYFRKRWGMV